MISRLRRLLPQSEPKKALLTEQKTFVETSLVLSQTFSDTSIVESKALPDASFVDFQALFKVSRTWRDKIQSV